MRCFFRKMALVLAGGLAAALASAFDLVPMERVVVITFPTANPKASMAAKELREHFQLATECRPVLYELGDPIPDGAFEFRLESAPEDADLDFEEAFIHCDEDHYCIAGNDKGESNGTRFAVYEWLDHALGCRWLWPGELGRVVPRTTTISFETGDTKYVPQHKCSFWRPCVDSRAWPTPEGRDAYITVMALWQMRNRLFCDRNVQEYDHGFQPYWARYHETHPEWFNMLPDGTRRPDPLYENGAPTLISMCVSNPELAREVVINNINDPHFAIAGRINVSGNDTAGRCTCDNCMAWDDSPIPTEVRRARALERFQKNDRGWTDELGSLSARYAKFYLRVLAEADKMYPERHYELAGLIYGNFSEAPDLPMSPRIQQRFCPPIMYPWTREKIDLFKSQWDKWAKTGCRLLMRPNFTLDGYCFPISYIRPYVECFHFAHENGSLGFDADSLTGQFATQGVTLYGIARLITHPDMTAEEIQAEYCGAFGPAAPEIDAYFTRLADLSDYAGELLARPREPGALVGGNFVTFVRDAVRLFTPEVMAELNGYLDRAASLAADDDIAARRVAFLRLGLEQCQLAIDTQLAAAEYEKTQDIAAFAKAYAALTAFRTEHETDFACNIGFLNWLDGMTWPISKLT